MGIIARKFTPDDIESTIDIWNEIVEDGIAFPQMEQLDKQGGLDFFLSQSHTGVAIEESTGKMVGLYILHPNNVGRCAHIANASYAVAPGARGQGIGRTLVVHSLQTAKESGFLGLQYNAVVTTNETAVHLYEKLGFQRLARIENGFRADDGYRDTYIFFKTWPQHQS